jgi:hypothetical protein
MTMTTPKISAKRAASIRATIAETASIVATVAPFSEHGDSWERGRMRIVHAYQESATRVLQDATSGTLDGFTRDSFTREAESCAKQARANIDAILARWKSDGRSRSGSLNAALATIVRASDGHYLARIETMENDSLYLARGARTWEAVSSPNDAHDFDTEAQALETLQRVDLSALEVRA